MDSNDKQVSIREAEGVAWISIDRHERKNALNTTGRLELANAFDQARRSTETRVVVLTGSGGVFSAGVDLKEARPNERHVMAQDQEPLVTPVLNCPKPVIAAIDGAAVGGGFELALAADMRIATPRSFFALTEVTIGSLPGSGGTQRLFGAVPSAVAWRLLLTGERMSGERANQVGLVSDLFEAEDLEDEVWRLATSVAAAAPLSLRAVKVAGRVGMQHAGEAGLALERALWAFLSTTEDREEGRAAFREKRQPTYKGR